MIGYELTKKKDQLVDGDNRIISGSILWGWKSDEAHHYLGVFHLTSLCITLEGREKVIYLVGVIRYYKFSITLPQLVTS